LISSQECNWHVLKISAEIDKFKRWRYVRTSVRTQKSAFVFWNLLWFTDTVLTVYLS